MLPATAINEPKMANRTMAGFTNYSSMPCKTESDHNEHFQEGLKLFDKGRFSEAVLEFQKCQEETCSNFAKNNYYLGLAYWKMKQSEKAVFNLYKALDQGYPFDS